MDNEIKTFENWDYQNLAVLKKTCSILKCLSHSSNNRIFSIINFSRTRIIAARNAIDDPLVKS